MQKSAPPQNDAITELVTFFEELSPASLSKLDQHYAEQALFKDPFNEVNGPAAIRKIFEHMFETLVEPRFVVTEQMAQGEQCFLTWEFRFQFPKHQRGTEQAIMGASHLFFDANGKVIRHRDYWDAAEELYEKLPVLGTAMRWLKRRATA